MEDRKICAAYIRVSTHDQEEFSPDSQIKLVRDYAEKHNMVLPTEFIFRDDGISGRSAENRPGFQMMIAAAREKPRPFECILVWKFSRFARNQEESIVYKSLLKKENDIDVISISEPILEGPFGGLIERIIEWFDAFYSANLSTEVRRGMTERAERGLPMSVAPFGYKYHEGELVTVPEEAEEVKALYRGFLGGTSMLQLARSLNDRGIRTRRGGLWNNKTVRYVLTNPTYCGKIRWCPEGANDYYAGVIRENTMIVQGKHEPLVSEEEFERVQDRVTEFSVRYSHKHDKTPQGGAKFRLQGIVKCGTCGATMSRGGNGMNCSGYIHGLCRVSHFVTEERLEKMIFAAIRHQMTTLQFQVTDHRNRTPADEETARLQLRLKREEEILKRQKAAYAAGVDTLEEYKENRRIAEQRMERIRVQLSKRKPEKKFDKATFAKENLAKLDIIERKDTPPALGNEMLRTFVHRVTFHKSKERGGWVEVEYYA